MGIQDRDWYWDKHDKIAGRNRRTLTGKPTARRNSRVMPQSPWTYVLLVIVGITGWLWHEGRLTASGRPAPVSRLSLASHGVPINPKKDSVPYPTPGSVRMYRWAPPNSPTKLKLTETDLQPDKRIVVTVRDWTTKAAIADVYLAPNSSITFDMPAGTYGLQYAIGGNWRGDSELFGPGTAYFEVREQVALDATGYQSFTKEIVMNPKHGSMTAEPIGRAAFLSNE